MTKKTKQIAGNYHSRIKLTPKRIAFIKKVAELGMTYGDRFNDDCKEVNELSGVLYDFWQEAEALFPAKFLYTKQENNSTKKGGQ